MPPIILTLEDLQILFALRPLDLHDPKTGAAITLVLDGDLGWCDLIEAALAPLGASGPRFPIAGSGRA